MRAALFPSRTFLLAQPGLSPAPRPLRDSSRPHRQPRASQRVPAVPPLSARPVSLLAVVLPWPIPAGCSRPGVARPAGCSGVASPRRGSPSGCGRVPCAGVGHPQVSLPRSRAPSSAPAPRGLPALPSPLTSAPPRAAPGGCTRSDAPRRRSLPHAQSCPAQSLRAAAQRGLPGLRGCRGGPGAAWPQPRSAEGLPGATLSRLSGAQGCCCRRPLGFYWG